MADDGGNDREDGREAANASGPRDPGLSLDATLEVLAHRHRREILRVLVDSPARSANIDELTTSIESRETERTGERPGRDQIEMTLYHVHVPKLSDVGLVEYDARSRALRYRPNERLEEILEYVQSDRSD